MKIIKGRILQFVGNPFEVPIEKSVKVYEGGSLLIKGKFIAEIDYYSVLKKKYPDAYVYDYKDKLITAGFIDCHMHYPQTGIIASYGERLLDWLNKYTFPEELRFKNYDYAQNVASLTLDLCIKNGTTTASSFCTTSIESVNAFFNEAKKRKMLVVGGRTCMDRNAREDLLDTPKSSYDESEKLIKQWHDKDRIVYAISPRFAPTSSPEQLEALGHLWSKYPDCLMQTHLAEQPEEIKWVKQLYPDSTDYLNVYEKFGLVGKKSLFGHSIYLSEREIDCLRETGSSLAHCPTSNMFIGSGIFQLLKLASNNINIGLATDTGGGSSFSMIKTMSAAYEIAQLNGQSIHPAQLFWLATLGSSLSLNLDDKIGNLDVGKYADLVVINLSSTDVINQRRIRADNIWEELFPTIIMGDDRAIEETWISGSPVNISNQQNYNLK